MSHDPAVLWEEFSLRHQLTPYQMSLFQDYYNRLVSMNAVHNITTITDLDRVIADHFDDSLALVDLIKDNHPLGLADIGTGGGFPGIPLKIKFPQMPLYLLEVNEKNESFLLSLLRHSL